MPDTNRPTVVFFGSGPVAAESLRLLLEWCDVEAVITKPQPPHHRDKFPVIAIAEAHGVPMHFANNRRELDDVMAGQYFASRVAVLIDYGIIVSQAAIDSFELGIINSHFSLLPEWRGADPISFSILSGQQQTGVSLMLLVQAMDEGPLLSQGTYDIPADATTPSLTAVLIKLSDALLQDILPKYLSDESSADNRSIHARSQEEAMALFGKPYQPTYSRKLTKADGVLDFTRPAVELERQIRAFAEWPKSRTVIANKDVVVTQARVLAAEDISDETLATDKANPTRTIGDYFALPNKTIAVQTSEGLLVIERLKPAGKSEMDAASFLAGHHID